MQYVLNNTLIIQSNDLPNIAPIPEVCLVFLKTWAGEGSDRESLEVNWDGAALVNSVAANCANTVVITHSAGLNVMPWADNPNVTGILAAHLPGQESGNSIVDVLYGAVNPSGKLPYTIALNQSSYRFAGITNSTELQWTEDPNAWQSNFTEGLLIDYRHFDYYNQTVRYEFGFGLSYTTFNMSNLSIATTVPKPSVNLPKLVAPAPGGNPILWQILFTVNVTVSNTGSLSGAAVPQLYITFPKIPSSVPTPVRVLRGFDKVALEAGAAQTVQFLLMRRDLSYWDVDAQDWVLPNGCFRVGVGFSSRDIRLAEEFVVVETDG